MFNKFLQIYTKEEKLPSFSNDPYGRSILTELSFDSHLFKLRDSNNFIESSSNEIHDKNGNIIRKINGRWEEPNEFNIDNNNIIHNNQKSQNIQYAFIATLSTLLPIIIVLIIIISILIFYHIRQQSRFTSQRRN
ncbi:macrophage expressed 1 [Schistosoma haematobium]|uniref:Macrophage expressed 1 n=1 Tax=Schistosoma haematobium TaxID=6185 RepID=A0A922S3H8_SCHHA|nr:macrophage expressed 1 [Schistosoma haematobium]KAH9591904.1 macrophage expressed 1 [Schistosoma haematobium]